jgi:pyruvate,water dikinase
MTLIRRFAELCLADVPLVGGKNASLGELYRELAPKGVAVPDGFAVTADAYRAFMRSAGLAAVVRRALAHLDTRDVEQLRVRGQEVRHAILGADLPGDLARAITAAYDALGATAGGAIDVAVRSSATAEDLPEASFAGQQETFLNVHGHAAVLDACRRCFASLFTDRAISYRAERGFDHDAVALSIGIQRMVRSDLGAAGVMFTIDTESGFPDVVLINASYGLGENVVQGTVTPDEYYVFKPTLRAGFRPILRKRVGTKESKLVYDEGGTKGVRNVPVPLPDRGRFAIDDDDILRLARWACLVEDHYGARYGRPTPMDLEWAKDGRTGELFVVQARPETVQARKRRDVLETYRLHSRGPVLTAGQSVGERIGQGPAHVIANVESLGEFRDGEVLIADKTDPDWEPILKKAAAVVTNRGGRTCHAAIVSRELGIPAVVGTGNGTDTIHDGQQVTVSCAEGDRGFVYDGRLEFTVQRTELGDLARPRTKVMMNVGNPDEAFTLSFIPNDGVGLAREEFIISSTIKIHPLALLEYDRLDDAAAKAEIDRLTVGWTDKPSFFVDKLAEGVAMIAAAFHPKDVIVRLSDFKSNEYANLVGGRRYEPVEENPMLGFRGASRYYDARYRDGFALECRAMKKVREEMGLTNVKLMVPFCRTVGEAERVMAELARNGLRRGEGGLEVYVMCEIPSNAIGAEAFADVFDGFSIGSNDLTQLVLGVDRDSRIVAHIFDERDPAVKAMIAGAIRGAKAKGRKIGICGQAPSDYPEFAEFLVEQGIDSISLNPDAVLKTTLTILAAERASAPVATPAFRETRA